MRYADDVTILRASAVDEYGNPAASWASPEEIAAKAFVPGARSKAYFPTGTDLRPRDRLRLADGTVWAVESPITVRSPSRDVLMTCGLTRVEGS